MKIRHELVKVELERKRNMMDLSEQDLRLCFGARVDFIDEETGRELLKIEDTVIIGLAWELFDAFREALKSPDKEILVVDYYGTFSLTIKADGKIEKVNLTERHQKKIIVITVDDFRIVFSKWIYEIDHDMQANFPGIQENPNYVKLINELKQVS